MATYVDFATQTRRELEEATAGVFADESILAWKNDAADDLAVRLKCQEDEEYTTVVAGQQSYALPDYSLEVKALYYNGNPLEREDFTDWYALAASGTPHSYTVSADALYLRPIPDTANDGTEVRYFRYRTPAPTTSIAATESMPFASRHDRAIREYVKSRAFQQIGDWDGYRAASEAYERYVEREVSQQAIEREAAKPSYAPREVW